MADGNGFFGQSPFRTLVWLAVVSAIVGFVFVTLNIDPVRLIETIFSNFDEFLRMLADLLAGFLGLFRHIWRYFLAGAVIVIPLWLLSRLFASRRGR